MLFNFRMCKCLHTGHGNEDAQYTMCGTVLNSTANEKDLGLTISADMKVSEQCGNAAWCSCQENNNKMQSFPFTWLLNP